VPTEAKRETVASLTEEARRSSAIIVSEYRGLKVSELGEVRKSLRKQNVSYHVVKNRLMKIAATDAERERLSLLLDGPTAVAFGSGDEAAVAKAVLDALRPYRVVKIKGALIGARSVVDAEGVTRLSQLPGRDVLIGQLAGALAAPMATLVGALSASIRELAAVVQAVGDSKAQATGEGA
jgi:large subunit ribosomal protein L10